MSHHDSPAQESPTWPGGKPPSQPPPGPLTAPSCCGARHEIASPPSPSSWGLFLQTLKQTQPVPPRTESCLSWEPCPTWGVLPSAPQRPAAHVPARSMSKVGARPPQASPPTSPTTGSQKTRVPLPHPAPRSRLTPLTLRLHLHAPAFNPQEHRPPDHLPSVLLRPSLSAAEAHAVSAEEGEPLPPPGPQPSELVSGHTQRHLPVGLPPGQGEGSACLQPQDFIQSWMRTSGPLTEPRRPSHAASTDPDRGTPRSWPGSDSVTH